jgi:iron complex outermembrane recepter protein
MVFDRRVHQRSEHARSGHRAARAHRHEDRVGASLGCRVRGLPDAQRLAVRRERQRLLRKSPERLTRRHQRHGIAAGVWRSGRRRWRGGLSAPVFGGTQGYDQTFSAVSADRTTEDLNRLQHVPTRVVGIGAQWARSFGRHTVLFGAEGKFIKGASQETQLSRGRVLGTSDNGGTQRTGSAFAQDTFLVSDRLTIVAGAHGDGWHSESQNTPYSKTLGSFNPRASFAYRLSGGVSIRGSAYGGFRAPTLNELYRGFRAGNTQTNPNEALLPERLTGADGGVLVARGRLSARVTGFWNVLDDTITNITLSITPQLITKQRANADKCAQPGSSSKAT